ncbi:conserved oligomeric Golgi complex subunit 3 [Diutina catenulata]
MVRNRRHTIVEEIASAEDVVRETTPLPPAPEVVRAPALARMPSIDGVVASGPSHDEKFPLDPVDAATKRQVWTRHSDKYAYQIHLDGAAIDAIEDLQMDRLLNFATVCRANTDGLSSLMGDTKSLLNQLTRLEASYYQVTGETADFDRESKRLLESSARQRAHHAEIESQLRYFESFDFIAKHLNRSGYALITSRATSFRDDILAKLDDAIAFLASHDSIKDVDVYRSRFRQCMTRSMTLIKNWLVDELKRRQDQVVAMANKAKATVPDVFIYTEFANYDTERFESWVAEIDKRIPDHAEYSGLLWDVTNQYFKTRLRLVSMAPPPKVPDDRAIVAACQGWISHYKKVVDREYAMYTKFFGATPNHEQLYFFLKVVLDPLYDAVRRMTLKETNIASLCELAGLLQQYADIEDVGDDTRSLASARTRGTERSSRAFDTASLARSLPQVEPESANGRSGPPQLSYAPLFQPVVDDVRARLIFRIQLYLDNTLMRYTPRAEDLALGRRRSAGDDAAHPLDAEFPANLFPETYPPLAKALTLLTTIYGLINNAVFDDLAHSIVHSCIELLRTSFVAAATAHLGPLDAKLLYVKNLVLLRDQVGSFDLRIVHNDWSIDFTSGISDVWHTWRQGQFSLNNAGVIEMVKRSVPRIVNNMSDANVEIDTELNNAVHDAILAAANMVSAPIIDAAPDSDPATVATEYKHSLITTIPAVHSSIVRFIADPAVRKYLMTHLTNLLVVTYENYYNSLVQSVADKSSINDVMEVDTMYGFMSDLVNEQFEKEST